MNETGSQLAARRMRRIAPPGRFERKIPVGMDIEENKIEASFKNGVLKAVLPKTGRAQTKAKRIAINSPAKH